MTKYILGKFHDWTNNRFWEYRNSGNEVLFCVINFIAWLITTILNTYSGSEMDLNDLYLLLAVLIFTYQKVLKEN